MLRSARDVAEDVALASGRQAARNVTADRLALVERLRAIASSLHANARSGAQLFSIGVLEHVVYQLESEIRAAAEGEE